MRRGTKELEALKVRDYARLGLDRAAVIITSTQRATLFLSRVLDSCCSEFRNHFAEISVLL